MLELASMEPVAGAAYSPTEVMESLPASSPSVRVPRLGLV